VIGDDGLNELQGLGTMGLEKGETGCGRRI